MKIIYNKIIPFKGFSTINLFGILFTRSSHLSNETINHEQIHTAQMKEMLYIFFYLWYFVEWLIRLVLGQKAYRSISFEQEAYSNENNGSYLLDRKPFAWLWFLDTRYK